MRNELSKNTADPRFYTNPYFRPWKTPLFGSHFDGKSGLLTCQPHLISVSGTKVRSPVTMQVAQVINAKTPATVIGREQIRRRSSGRSVGRVYP